MTRIPVLEVKDLKKYFRKGRAKVKALRGVNFKIYPTSAQSLHSNFACSSTVSVAFCCLSGG